MTLRDSMPITAAALDRLKFNSRAVLCEILTKWALRVAPKGYVPGMVLACVDAYRREGDFGRVNEQSALGSTLLPFNGLQEQEQKR